MIDLTKVKRIRAGQDVEIWKVSDDKIFGRVMHFKNDWRSSHWNLDGSVHSGMKCSSDLMEEPFELEPQ